MEINDLNIVIRIFCATFCGAIVGWERERREKSAGLRTHMYVCMGSALVMIVSTYGFSQVLTKGTIVLDPSRIAAQVVTGVGFLGAGVIWFARNKVRGLDTAAGIWTTSAVGLAAGAGMFVPALMVAGTIVVMNNLLKPVEERFFPRHKAASFTINFDGIADVAQIRTMVDEIGLKVRTARLAHGGDSGTVGLDVNAPKGVDWLCVVDRVQQVPGVLSVTYNGAIGEKE